MDFLDLLALADMRDRLKERIEAASEDAPAVEEVEVMSAA